MAACKFKIIYIRFQTRYQQISNSYTDVQQSIENSLMLVGQARSGKIQGAPELKFVNLVDILSRRRDI